MKIFLSSTYSDLEQHRHAVMEALAECEVLYKGMEFFGASEKNSIETCLSHLAAADQMMVLIGTRYGSRPNPNKPSFTELEIYEAERLEIPIWVYFLDTDNQRVLAKHVDAGSDATALSALKERLLKKYTVEKFTTPEDLARRLARNLLRQERNGVSRHRDDQSMIRYRETAYDALAEWYDIWYQGHWRGDEPYKTVVSIVRSYREAARGNISQLQILDCACGTGNTFCSFTQHGHHIYGTDGSREMLLRAKHNCDSLRIPSDKLVLEPINWTDSRSYEERFGANSFDLILNTANSFCHIPPVPEQMDVALSNFVNLLRPGGLLVIDTKRYIRGDPENEVQTYRELRYMAQEQEWITRSERHELAEHPDLGAVNFHTRLFYDDDPSFSTPVRRALIVVTIFGETVTPRTLVIPYYPLPARVLQDHMKKAGLETTVLPAMQQHLACNWKYDLIVGLKPK